MPPKARKKAPAAKASRGAKQSRAVAAGAQQPRGSRAPRKDEMDIIGPDPDRAQSEGPQDAAPADGEVATTSANSGALLTDETTNDARSSTRFDADGAQVVLSTSTHSTRRLREYEPGHTVEETVTVNRERTERIPVPYAGPVSDHPAPVG